MIYSEGLINAYNLEIKKAIYPRIVIDEKVINWINENTILAKIINKFILKSSDGICFLDYLELLKVRRPDQYEY